MASGVNLQLERRTKKVKTWPAWNGEMSEVKKLASLVSKAHEEQEGEARRRREESQRKAEESGIRIGAIHSSSVYFYGQSSLDNVAPVYPFIGIILTDDEIVTGSIDDVFPEIDRRSFQRVELVGAQAPNNYVSISLNAKEHPAMRLTVDSHNTSWARQTFVRISDEIEKGVPRWGFMRIATPLTLVLKALPAALMAIGTSLAIPAEADSPIYIVTALMGILMAFYFVASEKVEDFFFPLIEITGEGSQSIGGRRITALLLTLASVPIGIMVNLIT